MPPMALPLPDGHPGDLAWRLPLGRILAGMKAVNEAQLGEALAACKKGGLYLTHLQEVGVSSEKLLRAWSLATGLDPAPTAEVRRPPSALADGASPEPFRRWLAVPYREASGALTVAFVVPPYAGTQTGLPRHTATVALESDVRAGLEALWPQTAEPVPEPVPVPERVSDDDLRRAGLVVHASAPPGPDTAQQLSRLKVPALVVVVLLAGWFGYGAVTAKRPAPPPAPVAAEPQPDSPPVASPEQVPAVRAALPGSLEALTAAINTLTDANASGGAADFWAACPRLAEALSSYQSSAPAGQARADLGQLSTQAQAFCASGGGVLQPKHWAELRRRVLRVLAGEPAGAPVAVDELPPPQALADAG
jgi:hypothetical protein